MTAQDSEQQPNELENLPPGLLWGIKRSFVSYVAQLRDGGQTTSGGASLVLGSLFHFVQADGSTYDPTTGTGTLKFTGQVHLSGHFGMLAVRLSDPWVEFRGADTVLSVVDHRSPRGGSRFDLATLETATPATPEPGVYIWPQLPTALTATGQWLFNDQYPAEQPLDPLFIVYRFPAATEEATEA